MDISVIIPVLNEADNMKALMPLLCDVLDSLNCSYEIAAVDGGSVDGTRSVVLDAGGKVIEQKSAGYGNAIREGIAGTKGDYIIAMDGDLSHSPGFIVRMWENRHQAELIIGSRYVPDGSAQMPAHRYIMSVILNKFFGFGLSVKIRDISSGYRMYNRKIFDEIDISSRDFEVQQEILMKTLAYGWRVIEVPFNYRPRGRGLSHARLFKFGWRYLKTFVKMWRLRNSISSADYDERAYYSRIPLQRYWQRARHDTVLDFVGVETDILDIGCGTSKIIMDIPHAVALDISFKKLRYLKKTNRSLIQASCGQLPFTKNSFNCVICAEVIEHTLDENIFSEINRVLAPGGILILSTPDYSKPMWIILEFLYGLVQRGGYADDHVRKYTFREVKKILEGMGYEILKVSYLLNAQFTLKARKKA